jgi:hypothetical protein
MFHKSPAQALFFKGFFKDNHQISEFVLNWSNLTLYMGAESNSRDGCGGMEIPEEMDFRPLFSAIYLRFGPS